jgi:hypothetical protein
MKTTPETSRLLWVADGGHEWLRVPLDTCHGLDISTYSYQHQGYAYLEGDCDAGEWFRHYGFTPESVREMQIPAEHINGEWVGRTRYARYKQGK